MEEWGDENSKSVERELRSQTLCLVNIFVNKQQKVNIFTYMYFRLLDNTIKSAVNTGTFYYLAENMQP